MNYLKTSLVTAASAIAIIAAVPVSAANDTRATAGIQSSAELRIKADDLVGRNINNVSGEAIGDIESVIIDKSGKVAAVIVGVGGFLGMGEREVAIDWNDLLVSSNGENIQTGMTTEQLKALPQYRYEKDEYRHSAFIDPSYLGKRIEAATRVEWVDAHGLTARKLLGSNVVNAQGETVGEVDDLVVVNGRTMLILSVGEFLGMGGHDVAVDLDKAKVHRQLGDADDLRVSVSMSKEQLKALPKYDATKWNLH